VKVREENPSSFIKFTCPELGELIDGMTMKNVEKRYSIDDVLSSNFMKKFKPQEFASPLKVPLRLPKKKNNKEFSSLLRKLQKQITEKRMKIDQNSENSSQESLIQQPSKDAKKNLQKKFDTYFDKFETPQQRRIFRRIGDSSSVNQKDSSALKPRKNWRKNEQITTSIK